MPWKFEAHAGWTPRIKTTFTIACEQLLPAELRERRGETWASSRAVACLRNRDLARKEPGPHPNDLSSSSSLLTSGLIGTVLTHIGMKKEMRGKDRKLLFSSST